MIVTERMIPFFVWFSRHWVRTRYQLRCIAMALQGRPWIEFSIRLAVVLSMVQRNLCSFPYRCAEQGRIILQAASCTACRAACIYLADRHIKTILSDEPKSEKRKVCRSLGVTNHQIFRVIHQFRSEWIIYSADYHVHARKR